MTSFQVFLVQNDCLNRNQRRQRPDARGDAPVTSLGSRSGLPGVCLDLIRVTVGLSDIVCVIRFD